MPMKNPNHPGDIIRECLDELDVNVTEGAKLLWRLTRPRPAAMPKLKFLFRRRSHSRGLFHKG